MADSAPRRRICFVGLGSLPVLAREYKQHGVGGEQVQQTLLARAFVRRGYDVSMVVWDLGQPDGAIWDGVTTYKAYDLQAGIPGLRFIHPRWTGLWRAVKRASADVYYCSSASIIPGLLVLYARSCKPRPRVVFRLAHDLDCDPHSLLIRFWRDRKIYEYGIARADAILAQSEKQQQMLRENYNRESDVATMMVDAPDGDLPFEQRDIAILWVNNIRDFKRPDLAMELAARLPGLRLHMIGGTQPGFEDMYRQIQSQAKLTSNVEFYGPVPYQDVNKFYERARVFVNTSDSEGFPNSYLQAWARGTPVVAFFDPDGVIAREGLGEVASTLEDMSKIVAKLNSDANKWMAVSQRCRGYMAREYSEDRILAPYLQAL
jgi:glycosyltransferase involved in cell wall biosynthesis